MLCVIWWIFEPIPIPVTSIIPLAVFPSAGVLTKEDIARAYGDDMVLLMLGGFIMPVGMPPNAIVFGTGAVPINSMVREGLMLNFIGAAVITAVCYVLIA